MGAKGKYEKWLEPENLILVQGWRRDGLADDQVARNLGVSRSTMYEWIKRFPEFAEAFKKGTEACVFEVENAMYKSAMGYDVEEIEISETEYPDGAKVTSRRKKKRHIPPSTAAQIFILRNKAPGKWSNDPMPKSEESNPHDNLLEAINASAKKDWEEIEDEP